MIISRKKYLETIKEAACKAEAETAFRMHEKQRREDEARILDERLRELRQYNDRSIDDLCRQMRLMDERLRKLEGKHE